MGTLFSRESFKRLDDSSEGALMDQLNSAPPERVRGIKDEMDKLQLKLHWNSLYIHASLILKGINDTPCIIHTHLLIDSRATRYFVNTDTVFNLGIPVETLE